PSVDNQAPKDIALIPEVIPPGQDDSTGSPFSTTVDQDAPSLSKSHTTVETQSSVIPQDVEEENMDIEVAHMGNDPLLGVPIPGVISTQSSITVRLKVPVRRIRTDNGTEFVNQTLREYYEEAGISHETSVARSSQQNECSLLSDNDSENLGKLQPKDDIGIFIGYAPTNKAFRIYNRRTRRIVETIYVDFDELTAMASEHRSSRPALNEMTPGTISSRLEEGIDFEKSFAPVARLEAIRIFLA
nr:integrase, catalytic region, zinc finger, CCHC-type, peptidase aspartic, catalytic [Tanacetum cinerariifolium]